MKLKNINGTIDALVKNGSHSGCVLISTEKDVIYKKSFGFANIPKKLPISFKTQVLAGSVTKQFTAVAIFKSLLDQDGSNVRNFYLDLKVTYKAMPSLDITQPMTLKMLFLLAVMRMLDGHLQNSQKHIKILA